ncbi:MAG: IS1634 family transposase [SAR324 cluster bacterium]|nr:IS1634 family transposase [SAR324 cluster bacterium]
MEIEISRLDHHGVVAGVIKDLGLIEHIDRLLGVHEQSEISHGEAIAGMILNGLGFTDRPVSLSPQFFENKALAVLFREGVEASYFNRFKLGRSLDRVYAYGSERLFSELSVSVCRQEKVETRFSCEDTTSFSLTGDYLEDEDSHAILITHGYSKDHRPDLKQMVLEMMVSQDGGIPLLMKCWSGNSEDSAIFQQRAKALVETWKDMAIPRYFITDAKGYTKENALNLKLILFITRVPETLNLAREKIDEALAHNTWKIWDDRRKYQSFEVKHYDIDQRWLVVFSQPAQERAQQTIKRAVVKENEKISKAKYHLQAQRFESKNQARKALEKLQKTWKFHTLKDSTITENKRFLQQGRPNKNSASVLEFQIQFQVQEDTPGIERRIQQKACFIVTSNATKDNLTDLEILVGYQGQDHVEKGFGFLKSPLCFASSLFLDKPQRLEGLMMVMTLALLVYSVAQRRLRKALIQAKETLPNQIRQPITNPTMRWIFQCLEGINRVVIKTAGQVKVMIDGLNDLRRKIFRLMGGEVAKIYLVPSG